jgi:hypothetical protein
MSIISGLSNSALQSLPANSSTAKETGTASTSSSSLDALDTVSLTNKESLLESLLSSVSAADKSLSNLVQNEVILKAVEKANLFSTNPDLAKSLTGVSVNGSETTSSSGSSDLESYLDSLDAGSLCSLLNLKA